MTLHNVLGIPQVKKGTWFSSLPSQQAWCSQALYRGGQPVGQVRSRWVRLTAGQLKGSCRVQGCMPRSTPCQWQSVWI